MLGGMDAVDDEPDRGHLGEDQDRYLPAIPADHLAGNPFALGVDHPDRIGGGFGELNLGFHRVLAVDGEGVVNNQGYAVGARVEALG